jgi:aerobic-type carbon monoxide dehydrogenase small subunit (CoxS/CutS family)
MSGNFIDYAGQKISFNPGETVAAALENAGYISFGQDPLKQATRYFCGIGACQSCLVRINGIVRETCITPAVHGMRIESLEGSHA